MSVSIRDVAERAGVSVGTVSNVLNGRGNVAPESRRLVQEAIAALGYVRNDAARQLRAGRSRSIGLIVPDLANPFFADVIRGAEARAARDGLVVLVGNSDDDPERERAYLTLFLEQRVNGVLLTPSAGSGALGALGAAAVPLVLLDRESPDGTVPAVAVDDVEGGHLAASHLLAQGRRRLAYVSGPLSVPQVADRLEGARRAVAEHEGAVLEVLPRPALSVLEGRAAGQGVLARPAPERPDAVFAANDLLAVGVLQAFSMFGGIEVPGDIAIIGYDDIDFAAAAVVPLSSVRQPAREIGESAVELLLQELSGAPAGPRPVIRFRPELVVRRSSAS